MSHAIKCSLKNFTYPLFLAERNNKKKETTSPNSF